MAAKPTPNEFKLRKNLNLARPTDVFPMAKTLIKKNAILRKPSNLCAGYAFVLDYAFAKKYVADFHAASPGTRPGRLGKNAGFYGIFW